MDLAKIEAAVTMILEAIGEDTDREGLRDTPVRVARMYAELFSGVNKDPKDELRVLFEEPHREMILLRDIGFYSMCEHHLLPFYGRAHIAYIPSGKVVGVSKLIRVLEVAARRPQLQERLTSLVADSLLESLRPRGVVVVIEAEHMCMALRGVKKPGNKLVTSAVRGIFQTNPSTRAEAFSLIRNQG